MLAPGGRPVPVLLKKWSFKLNHVDLRHLPPKDREAEADRFLLEETARPFNLARDLMLRGTLLRMDDDDYIFLHITPHTAFEVGSVAILYRDLAAFYEGFLDGKPANLPELPIQYSDFADWQRKQLTPERLEVLRDFWKSQLEGAPLISLPLDYPRPAVHTMRGARHFWTTPPDLLAATHALFRESGTTPYRGLCAVFNVFLHCYTGQTDFSVGSPFAPRCAGAEGLIGFFVNTVVLRTDLSGNPTFRELMKRVDSVVRGAIQHSDLTFDKIVEVVRPLRDPSRHPLFQVNFRSPKSPYNALQLRGISAERARDLSNGTAKFDLALEMESSCGEACYFEYCADLFKKETIDQIVTDFKALLRGLISRPDVPLEDLPEVREISHRVQKHPTRLNR
jgi:aspartate racemase